MAYKVVWGQQGGGGRQVVARKGVALCGAYELLLTRARNVHRDTELEKEGVGKCEKEKSWGAVPPWCTVLSHRQRRVLEMEKRVLCSEVRKGEAMLEGRCRPSPPRSIHVLCPCIPANSGE